MKKIILITSLLLIVLSAAKAQDVFKKYGHNKEMLTLSKGKYQEVFKNEEIVQIGTVLINTKTNKVIQLLEVDTAKINYTAELSSRFLTIDPLAEKYPWISPYVYCYNNPINFIDPDGREGVVVSGSPGNHDNELHFLINGLDRAKAAQGRTEKGEVTTWIIYNDKEKGFSQEALSKYSALAKEADRKSVV